MAFTRVIKVIIIEIDYHFYKARLKGLSITLSEGIITLN
jgi:hypothetical protein